MSENINSAQTEAVDEFNMAEIDYHIIQRAAKILRAVNHRLRQQLIKTIYESKKLTVTELFVKLRLEQSVTSQHLAILRQSGVVSTERQGKFIYYFINPARLKEINEFAKEILR